MPAGTNYRSTNGGWPKRGGPWKRPHMSCESRTTTRSAGIERIDQEPQPGVAMTVESKRDSVEVEVVVIAHL